MAWAAVPTTLVGQVDAAIGGKTAIDLPQGKNLVGAFHWPVRTVIDPALLETLPESERRAGLAEVVKTGLLAGEPLWELADAELVRRCALFKTAVCLRDPHDRGERAVLNLGHTFAHALEAAAGLRGGQRTARRSRSGCAPRSDSRSSISGWTRPWLTRSTRCWRPGRCTSTSTAPGRRSAGTRRRRRGRVRLVLLEAPGKPVHGVELPDEDVRRALESLVA